LLQYSLGSNLATNHLNEPAIFIKYKSYEFFGKYIEIVEKIKLYGKDDKFLGERMNKLWGLVELLGKDTTQKDYYF
jgi:hypothetical protein